MASYFLTSLDLAAVSPTTRKRARSYSETMTLVIKDKEGVSLPEFYRRYGLDEFGNRPKYKRLSWYPPSYTDRAIARARQRQAKKVLQGMIIMEAPPPQEPKADQAAPPVASQNCQTDMAYCYHSCAQHEPTDAPAIKGITQGQQGQGKKGGKKQQKKKQGEDSDEEEAGQKSPQTKNMSTQTKKPGKGGKNQDNESDSDNESDVEADKKKNKNQQPNQQSKKKGQKKGNEQAQPPAVVYDHWGNILTDPKPASKPFFGPVDSIEDERIRNNKRALELAVWKNMQEDARRKDEKYIKEWYTDTAAKHQEGGMEWLLQRDLARRRIADHYDATGVFYNPASKQPGFSGHARTLPAPPPGYGIANGRHAPFAGPSFGQPPAGPAVPHPHAYCSPNPVFIPGEHATEGSVTSKGTITPPRRKHAQAQVEEQEPVIIYHDGGNYRTRNGQDVYVVKKGGNRIRNSPPSSDLRAQWHRQGHGPHQGQGQDLSALRAVLNQLRQDQNRGYGGNQGGPPPQRNQTPWGDAAGNANQNWGNNGGPPPQRNQTPWGDAGGNGNQNWGNNEGPPPQRNQTPWGDAGGNGNQNWGNNGGHGNQNWGNDGGNGNQNGANNGGRHGNQNWGNTGGDGNQAWGNNDNNPNDQGWNNDGGHDQNWDKNPEWNQYEPQNDGRAGNMNNQGRNNFQNDNAAWNINNDDQFGGDNGNNPDNWGDQDQGDDQWGDGANPNKGYTGHGGHYQTQQQGGNGGWNGNDEKQPSRRNGPNQGLRNDNNFGNQGNNRDGHGGNGYEIEPELNKYIQQDPQAPRNSPAHSRTGRQQTRRGPPVPPPRNPDYKNNAEWV